MSVRKRIWTTSSGETKESWMVLYRDSQGDRCQETFGRKKDADARQAEIKIEMQVWHPRRIEQVPRQWRQPQSIGSVQPSRPVWSVRRWSNIGSM